MDYKKRKKSFRCPTSGMDSTCRLIIYLYALQQEGLDRYRARLTAELNGNHVPGGLYCSGAHDELPDAARDTDEEGLRILRDKALRRSGLTERRYVAARGNGARSGG